jgi:hypothetical protein
VITVLPFSSFFVVVDPSGFLIGIVVPSVVPNPTVTRLIPCCAARLASV